MRASVRFYFPWRQRALNSWTLQLSGFFFLFSFLASPPRFPPSLRSLKLAEANHWLAWHLWNSSSATATTSRWRQTNWEGGWSECKASWTTIRKWSAACHRQESRVKTPRVWWIVGWPDWPGCQSLIGRSCPESQSCKATKSLVEIPEQRLVIKPMGRIDGVLEQRKLFSGCSCLWTHPVRAPQRSTTNPFGCAWIKKRLAVA